MYTYIHTYTWIYVYICMYIYIYTYESLTPKNVEWCAEFLFLLCVSEILFQSHKHTLLRTIISCRPILMHRDKPLTQAKEQSNIQILIHKQEWTHTHTNTLTKLTPTLPFSLWAMRQLLRSVPWRLQHEHTNKHANQKTRDQRKLRPIYTVAHVYCVRLDWCCFYYFVRNRLVALLESLCASIHCSPCPLCMIWKPTQRQRL